MEFKAFGIIGYGSFGRFMAESLVKQGMVRITGRNPAKLAPTQPDIIVVDLVELAKSDVVIVAVPFAALAEVLDQLRPHLPKTTVVMDVTSTKVFATKLLRQKLPGHANWIATHPLFGPPSMLRMELGQRLVVTGQAGPRAPQFLNFLRLKFGLSIIEMDPDDHDQAMALMQALPFFIARGVVELGILKLPHRDELAIPSFQKLAGIAEIELSHSEDMYKTSQLSNPYAAEARRHFRAVLDKLAKDLGD